jgi:hypothetical protein
MRRLIATLAVMSLTTGEALFVPALLIATPAMADELPSETLGTWQRGDLCAGESDIKITPRSVSYGMGRGNWNTCSVLSVSSDHPGWHTFSITMRCSDRRRELWHVTKIEGHTYLIQTGPKASPEEPSPFISVARKCD